jgi:hydroxymethylglutaryl-CoA reductase
MTRGFRKRSVRERARTIADEKGLSDEQQAALFNGETLDMADVMVESAFGTFPLPLGLVGELIVDGTRYSVPMATEEPSVIAAAGFACRTVARAGGFSTEISDPVMTTQLLVENPDGDAEKRIEEGTEEIVRALEPVLRSMTRRGGGFRGIETRRLPERSEGSEPSEGGKGSDVELQDRRHRNAPHGEPGELLVVELHVDVRDAMGANVLNTAAETIRPFVAELTGGSVLMAILTNAGRRRMVRSSFRLPVRYLARGGLDGAEVARRLEVAAYFADQDENRAVTHNKGIMNGITAVTLATANDTRAVEAAAHAYAARSGRYRSLTSFVREGDELVASLELPLALGTVGGAVSFHPAAQAALRILGHPSAQDLARIAASVGLGQNLAAMWALVSEGIQQGHMRLHSRRVAWRAGARGGEIETLAGELQQHGISSVPEARRVLEAHRRESAPITEEKRAMNRHLNTHAVHDGGARARRP